MVEENFGVVTFESTQHAINGEKLLKDKGLTFKTIPTPREITLSCGLSIRFDMDDFETIENIYEENKLVVKGIYKFVVDNNGRRLMKLK